MGYSSVFASFLSAFLASSAPDPQWGLDRTNGAASTSAVSALRAAAQASSNVKFRPIKVQVQGRPDTGNATRLHPNVSVSTYRARLDTDLQSEARSWASNRYVPGSISVTDTNFVREAPDEWVAVIADYRYLDRGVSRTGWILAWYKNGTINCMGFHDDPGGCRAPRNDETRAAQALADREAERRAAQRQRNIALCQQLATNRTTYNECSRVY